jgi:hypothetical protein
MNWISVYQDRDQQQVTVHTGVNHRVSRNAENFLSN